MSQFLKTLKWRRKQQHDASVFFCLFFKTQPLIVSGLPTGYLQHVACLKYLFESTSLEFNNHVLSNERDTMFTTDIL